MTPYHTHVQSQLQVQICSLLMLVHVDTVDREIFTLKIILEKNFRVVKFLRFCSIRDNFLTVADYNMDERVESSHCLVYYRVLGEPGIAGCRRLDIYPGECGLARISLFIDRHRVSLIFAC